MTTTAALASDQLRSIVERIERLQVEKKTITDDISDVYSEAKSSGYDVKALRKIVAERKQDANERAEQGTILDLYRRALGMLNGTPLGDAAVAAATRPRGAYRTTGGRAGDGNRNTRMAG